MHGINFRRDFLPHIIVLIIFLILTCIYFYPAFQGKVLSQHDMKQWRASIQEAKEYNNSHEDVTRWSNAKFSGMPTYNGMGKFEASSWLVKPFYKSILKAFPENIGLIFIAMVGFYFMMVSLGFSIPIGVISAIAFGFCANNLISLDAGHLTKVRAMAFGPFVLGSVLLTFRKRKLFLGPALTSFFLAITVSSNHPQITYYLGIATGLYLLVELIYAYRNSDLAYFGKAVGLLALAALLGLGSHSQRLGTLYEYSKASTRGFESPMDKGEPNSGLDQDYVFNWSYGILETGNLIIPNLTGGSSSKNFVSEKDSETFQALRSLQRRGNIGRREMNNVYRATTHYFGAQPMTSGPIYIGAIICFLFVLSLFLLQGPMKWWLVITTILAIMLAWGNNFLAFNKLFYEYFPLYSKFRTVTMILYLVQLSLPFLGGMALKRIFYDGLDKATIQGAVRNAFIITGGICLAFAVVPGVFTDFTSGGDQTKFLAKNAPQVLESLKSDRASLVRADAFRSLIFIALAAGTLYLFAMNTLKERLTLLIIGGLVIADLWGVDKRYLSADNFQQKGEQAQFTKSYADQQILKDEDPHYRVLDLTNSPFNNTEASYYHKTIGGYSGAKMGRYQDLIDYQLQDEINFIKREQSKGNFIRRSRQGPVQAVINPQRAKEMTVLNMLNMKYLILSGREKGKLPIRNPANYGNAWFVQNLVGFDDGAKVMRSLDTVNPKKTALYNKKHGDYLSGFEMDYDPNAKIQLTKYEPNEVVYKSKTSSPQFAVFSEVYYDDGKGWKVYIDGEEKEHMLVNYVLRGMKVPEGKHTIRFEFKPQTPRKLGKVSIASDIIIVLLVLGVLGHQFYRYINQPKPESTTSSKQNQASASGGKKGKKKK